MPCSSQQGGCCSPSLVPWHCWGPPCPTVEGAWPSSMPANASRDEPGEEGPERPAPLLRGQGGTAKQVHCTGICSFPVSVSSYKKDVGEIPSPSPG